MPSIAITQQNAIPLDEINVIMLIDRSTSMRGNRIIQLNSAMPDVKRSLAECAKQFNVNVKLRVIAFSGTPEWKIGAVEQGEAIENVVWQPLEVDYGTNTADVIREATKSLHAKYMGAKALRPVVILLTDGYTGSDMADYTAAIDEMKHCLGGNENRDKVTRVAIGVQDHNRAELEMFASKGTLNGVADQPLIFEVFDSDTIGDVINWVAVTSMKSSIGQKGDQKPEFTTDDDIL